MSPCPRSCLRTSVSLATNVSRRPNWRCFGSASGWVSALDTSRADSGTDTVTVTGSGAVTVTAGDASRDGSRVASREGSRDGSRVASRVASRAAGETAPARRADTDGDGGRSSRRAVGGVVEPIGTGIRRAVGGVPAPADLRTVGGVEAPAGAWVGVFRPAGGVLTPANEAARRTIAGGEGETGAAFRAEGGVASRRGIFEPLEDRERGGRGDSRPAGVAGGVARVCVAWWLLLMAAAAAAGAAGAVWQL